MDFETRREAGDYREAEVTIGNAKGRRLALQEEVGRLYRRLFEIQQDAGRTVRDANEEAIAHEKVNGDADYLMTGIKETLKRFKIDGECNSFRCSSMYF
jgi:hypothetical protein